MFTSIYAIKNHEHKNQATNIILLVAFFTSHLLYFFKSFLIKSIAKAHIIKNEIKNKVDFAKDIPM